MNPSQPVPTVAVVNEDSDTGFCLINESDFDEDTHKKFKGDTSQEPKDPADPIDDMDKDAVIAALTEAGAEFNKNLGVKKLREILREAQKTPDE